MTELLKIYLSLSVTGAIMIGIMFLAKRFVKESFSKTWQYYVWLLVIIRMLVPLTLPTNLMNQVAQNTLQQTEWMNQETVIPTPNPEPIEQLIITGLENSDSPYFQADLHQRAEQPVQLWEQLKSVLNISLADVFVVLWLIGAIISFAWRVKQYITFKHQIMNCSRPVVSEEILQQYHLAVKNKQVHHIPGLYQCDEISTPIYIGIFSKAIIIPSIRRTSDEYYLALLHELTHYKRCDALYSWILKLVVSIHWFNPLVYLMEREIGHVCELSCDETVIRKMDNETIRSYGDTLINTAQYCVSRTRNMNSFALLEKKGLLKERILSIMNYKKKNTLVLIAMIVATVVLCVGAFILGGYHTKSEATGVTEPSITEPAEPNINEAIDTDIEDSTEPTDNDETSFINYSAEWDGTTFSSTRSFYINDYVYELMMTNKATLKTQYKVDITTDNGENFAIYFKNETDMNQFGQNTDLLNAFIKTKGDFGKDSGSEVFCILNRYLEVGHDFAQIMKDNYADHENWILAAIIPVIDEPLKLDYAKKSFDDDRIEVFGMLEHYLTQATQKEYFGKAYDEDKVNFFGLLENDVTADEKKVFAKKAYEDDKINFFGVVEEFLSTDEKEEIAKKACEDDKINFFGALEESLTADTRKEIAEKAYNDDKINFFGSVESFLTVEDRKGFAERAYSDKKINFFSVLMGDMDEATKKSFYDRAVKDKRVSFQALLEEY